MVRKNSGLVNFVPGIAFIEGLSHWYNFVPFIETGREGLNWYQRISVCKFRPETYSDVTNFSAGMTPNAEEQSTHNKRSILLRTVLPHYRTFSLLRGSLGKHYHLRSPVLFLVGAVD